MERLQIFRADSKRCLRRIVAFAYSESCQDPVAFISAGRECPNCGLRRPVRRDHSVIALKTHISAFILHVSMKTE